MCIYFLPSAHGGLDPWWWWWADEKEEAGRKDGAWASVRGRAGSCTHAWSRLGRLLPSAEEALPVHIYCTQNFILGGGHHSSGHTLGRVYSGPTPVFSGIQFTFKGTIPTIFIWQTLKCENAPLPRTDNLLPRSSSKGGFP